MIDCDYNFYILNKVIIYMKHDDVITIKKLIIYLFFFRKNARYRKKNK